MPLIVTLRRLLRHYSEIYTVFLPLFSVFLVLYICILIFSGRHPIAPSPGLPSPGDSEDTLIYLHRSLVEIPSVTNDEYEVSQFLNRYLTSKGWTVELQSVSSVPPRNNVFAYRGSSRTTKVLLTSHIDTVPPFIPYSTKDGFLWGRGSVDAKASVAAQITAAQDMLASGAIAEEGDISLLFVVGEETDGIGMETANELGLNLQAAIFGEPTELKLAIGHKGLLIAELASTGKAAHSGYPELGINANYFLVEALYRLQHTSYPASSLLGDTTFNAGQIRGGVADNVIPANASAGLTVRVAADLDAVIALMHEAVDAVPHVDLDITLTYDPVLCDYDIPEFDTTVAAYGTDIPHLRGNHKKYLYGPGSILLAHAENEHIALEDLRDSVVGYKKLVAYSLGYDIDAVVNTSSQVRV
ncbi:uncharacterized protein V1516DRAFT_129356 [Lipomyces oligophaga]|uniref:uncharacterized protein n=1 Tax=Lipomyces oligophaga TaxID=45792 RepID=UPI0034CEA12D